MNGYFNGFEAVRSFIIFMTAYCGSAMLMTGVVTKSNLTTAALYAFMWTILVSGLKYAVSRYYDKRSN